MSDDSTLIDQKKTNQSMPADPKRFASSFFSHIIFVVFLGVVCIGSIGLYTCKIAQANVLPDLTTLAPFADKMRNVAPEEVNINIVKDYSSLGGLGWLIFENPKYIGSEKVYFDNDSIMKSFYKGVLGRVSVYGKDGGNYWLYFTDVINSIIATNHSITNHVFQWLNSHLSEWTIMIFYTLFFVFFLVGSIFLQFFITLWYHVKHIPDLFRGKDSATGEWNESGTSDYLHPFRWFWAFVLFWVSLIPFSLIWIATSIYSFIVPLTIPYKTSDGKEHGFGQFLMDALFHKKQLIMGLISLVLLNKSSQYLGGVYTAGAFVAILGAVWLGLFKPNISDVRLTNGLASFKPAHVSIGKHITVDMFRKLTKVI
jgi:hypothetical protein